MKAQLEPEVTRPLRRDELRELVQEMRTHDATTRIPRLTLVSLLQEERELATPIELASPVQPTAVEITERVWQRGSGTFATTVDSRNRLALAFVSAVVAGMLMTAPLWW